MWEEIVGRLKSGSYGSHLFLLLFLIFFPGCVYLIVGSLGAMGGYVVSPDTVEGITSRDKDEVWDATTEILSIMGIILSKAEKSGMVQAKVQGTKVTVEITPLSEAAVKFSVRARKMGFPRIKVAQEIYVKVMSFLND